jgi:hypothetical protein
LNNSTPFLSSSIVPSESLRTYIIKKVQEYIHLFRSSHPFLPGLVKMSEVVYASSKFHSSSRSEATANFIGEEGCVRLAVFEAEKNLALVHEIH